MSRVEWHGEQFRGVLTSAVVDGLNTVAEHLRSHVQRKIARRGGGVPSAPGQPPTTQSGQLRGRIGVRRANAGDLSASVSAGVRYARILELGGTITPTRSRYLTVPLSDKARKIRRRTPDLRSLKLDWMPSRRASGGLLGHRTRGGGFRALFALVPRVHIMPRPYLMPALREAAPRMASIFRARVGDRVRAAAFSIISGGRP